MNDFSFFWHDYETFGRTPRRDWPAQFAGIRTDAGLNEVGEPLMIHCQPPTDRLPEPEACLLTGITPQHCAEQGLPEYGFALQIEQALAAPGTVGVGYNSLRFDDEVTRHLFWRNLIDPYGREWQNGCGRWDLMDAMRCAFALRPDGIEWPRHDDGRVSFKLEHLTAANGLAHEAAHDALSDVRATIALARLLRERKLALFDFCLKLRRKEAVWQEIGVLGEKSRPFLHVSGRYPTERGCLALVYPLGLHPTNKNELIVWDLAADPSELLEQDADTLRQRLFTRTDDLSEGRLRLPVKTIHVNRSPVVIAQLKTLSPQMAERWGLDVTQGLAHAAWAQQHQAALQALGGEVWPQVFARPALERAADVDEDLYGGFISPGDRRSLDRLRAQAANPQPAQATWRASFSDPRLAELVFRYRARNFPATLDDDDRSRWRQHCSARLHDGVGGALNLADYHALIDQLGEQADERGQDILGALLEWGEQIAPELA